MNQHSNLSRTDRCAGCIRLRKPQRAFTLVELLIVVAIIGLLVSILMPSLLGARKLAIRTQCLTNVRELYVAHTAYLMEDQHFPALNKEYEDGAWQYNYLIYDGDDFNQNFGPLVRRKYIHEMKQLYCPVQEDRFHSLATADNPWPVKHNLDTRAGYARRHMLSGISYSRVPMYKAIICDLMHLPTVVESAHKTGVNVAYGGGHANWVEAPRILLHNELDHPFDPLDNPLVEQIWQSLDEHKEVPIEDEEDGNP